MTSRAAARSTPRRPHPCSANSWAAPTHTYGPVSNAAAGGRRRRALRVAARGAPLRSRSRARDRARRPCRPGDDRRRRRGVAGGPGRVRSAPGASPILYAGDMNATTSSAARPAAGADLVVGDSNRRREFLPQSTQQNLGATLGQSRAARHRRCRHRPVPRGRGNDGQTVSRPATARAICTLRAPRRAASSPRTARSRRSTATPRPPGSPTATSAPSQRWIEVGFDAPRDVPYVDVDPLSTPTASSPRSTSTACVTRVGRGFTRIPVNLHHVSRAARHDRPRGPAEGRAAAAPAAFARSGSRASTCASCCAPPVLIGRDLAGTDLRHDSLSYVFERTTGDDPFRRNPYGTATVLERSSGSRRRRSPDRAARVRARCSLATPCRRGSYPAVTAADSTLDRMAGYTGPERFDSSSRFQDQPAYRASSAFSGRPGAGWIGLWAPAEAPDPWISWTTPRPLRVSQRAADAVHPAGAPADAGADRAGRADRVGPLHGRRGWNRLPAQRGHRAEPPRDDPERGVPGRRHRPRAQARAVGIGSVSVAGLEPVAIPASGPLHAPCGTAAVSVSGRRVPLAPQGTVAELDAGRPLRATACGSGAAPVPMGAGVQSHRLASGPVQRRPAAAELAGAVACRGASLGRPRRRRRAHRPELGDRRAGRAQRPVLAGARREL